MSCLQDYELLVCGGRNGVRAACASAARLPTLGKQVALGERVRFGNDRDGVDACTKMLYDLNVERLEIKQGQSRPKGLMNYMKTVRMASRPDEV